MKYKTHRCKSIFIYLVSEGSINTPFFQKNECSWFNMASLNTITRWFSFINWQMTLCITAKKHCLINKIGGNLSVWLSVGAHRFLWMDRAYGPSFLTHISSSNYNLFLQLFLLIYRLLLTVLSISVLRHKEFSDSHGTWLAA